MKLCVLILAVMLWIPVSAQDLNWQNWTDGYGAVKSKKRPAIIDFYTDWCKWCKVMDEKTFRDPAVTAMLKKSFVTMRINPETSKETIGYDNKQFSAAEFAQGLGVQGYPALAFMDKEGKFITLLPGFIPPETFIQLLKYVKDECYAKNVSFDDYQKNGGKCAGGKAPKPPDKGKP
jgi:thioredoxin-related protein